MPAPCPPNPPLQIAVRTCREEAGGLEEVHFFMFDQAALDAWVEAAEKAELPREEGEGEEGQAPAAKGEL